MSGNRGFMNNNGVKIITSFIPNNHLSNNNTPIISIIINISICVISPIIKCFFQPLMLIVKDT